MWLVSDSSFTNIVKFPFSYFFLLWCFCPICLYITNRDFSLVCTKITGEMYSFGLPQYGQCGHGTTGEFIAKAGSVREILLVDMRIYTYTLVCVGMSVG